MDVYQEIKTRMERYPYVALVEEAHGLSVTPDNGFTVWIASNDNYFSVGFDGWHEHFEAAEEALKFFAWGLSDRCRLKIVSRGRTQCKWVTESLEDGEWVEVSTTGLFFFPFWRKAEVTYKQNHLILTA